MEVETDRLCEVELTKISVNPFQPRRDFSETELEELASSIQMVGLIQPPVVRERPDGCYELISGERRYRAAQLVGLHKIPVLVRDGSRMFSAQAALIENIQRVDLSPVEVAKALRRLIEEFGFQQDELARRVGKKRSTVTNYLRLLALPTKILDSLASGVLSMGHAKAILALGEEEKQHLLHERILRENLSVREAEVAAQHMSKRVKPRLERIETETDCHLQEVGDRIQQRLGTKVTVQGRGEKGKVTIDYYNLDDLDRLISLIGA